MTSPAPSWVPPTAFEEVDRKAVEELTRILSMHKNCAIGAQQVKERLDTLWQITSGVVSKETMDLINQARNEYSEYDAISYTRVLAKGCKLAVVQIVPEECAVYSYFAYEGADQVTVQKREFPLHTPKEARDHWSNLLAGLHSRGFKPLNM
jgi:hypothetical protein